MKLRAMFAIALWSALVVGAVQVLDRRGGHAEIAAGVVFAGLVSARAAVAVRKRWRRVRSWRRPGETELAPAGPRRVLLVETGLAGPR